jgi:uncharacterized membrane protein
VHSHGPHISAQFVLAFAGLLVLMLFLALNVH